MPERKLEAVACPERAGCNPSLPEKSGTMTLVRGTNTCKIRCFRSIDCCASQRQRSDCLAWLLSPPSMMRQPWAR